MYCRLTAALFTLTLAVLPAFGQTVETLTGSLRSISSTELALDTGDDHVSLVQIQNGTKYLSTMGKVKPSDFEPGDHITVEAARDENGHYRSTTITLNKKASAEDKENARQTATPAAAQASAPDRPRLRRPSSGGGDAGSQTPNAGSAQQSAPLISSAPDGVPSSTVSGRRPPVSSQPDSTGSRADDSAVPVLRRSSPAPSDAVPAEQTASAERPSLSASEVNGVTRAPAVPVVTGPEREAPGFAGEDPVIEQTREVAFSFTETLPNYIVKQFTTRYRSDAASRGRTSWQALDVVTADVVYLNGKENYLNIMDNGRPTRDAAQTGSWSEGEFASSLQALLSPISATDFRNKRPVVIVSRGAWKYDYTIEQQHSAWRIQTEGQMYQPSYTGSIWIDKETFRVLRIEMASRNIPRSFPIDTTESSIDYDFVPIGGQMYLLPVHSESLSCWRGTSHCARNVIDFRNYRKYTADTSITFEGTTPNQ